MPRQITEILADLERLEDELRQAQSDLRDTVKRQIATTGYVGGGKTSADPTIADHFGNRK